MNRRWMGGLLALACLAPLRAGAVAPPGDPVADRFSFPVGSLPNNPTTSRYQAPDGHSYFGWTVHPAAGFLSPGYGQELQPGEDWGGRGGGDTDLGQPVYAAAAGTIVAASDYGDRWGHIVLIRHTLPGGQVVLTQYAYLADIVKSSGTVAWRELIGHIGRGSGGSVLHFEVRRDTMVEFPANYWPSSDGKDSDWVRAHYFSPTQFVRTHYRILTPTAPSTPPGEPGAPGVSPGPGTGPGGGTLTPPGTPGTLTPPGTPASAWDGVPHLDGSLLRSAAGDYFLLQSGRKWSIPTTEVLATWAHPEEALAVTDDELASYPQGSHPLGLRAGVLFKNGYGPTCISADPFDPAGLACWVIDNDQVFASHGFSRNAVRSVTAATAQLYIRPTPFGQASPLPRGVLIKKPYGDYYLVDDVSPYSPQVHPVTSLAALHSWQMDEATAVTVWDDNFWDRALKLEPLRFRPGAILQSRSGQPYVVSGEYKYLVASPSVFQLRGYNPANALPATDAELALHKDWPTPLR